MKLLAEIDARLYVFMGLMEERLHLYKIARAVSFTGDGYAYLLVAAVLLIVSPEAGLAVTLCGFLAFAFELPTYAVLKKTFKRRRPDLVVERFSFLKEMPRTTKVDFTAFAIFNISSAIFNIIYFYSNWQN